MLRAILRGTKSPKGTLVHRRHARVQAGSVPPLGSRPMLGEIAVREVQSWWWRGRESGSERTNGSDAAAMPRPVSSEVLARREGIAELFFFELYYLQWVPLAARR